jgi:hypothetical protein
MKGKLERERPKLARAIDLPKGKFKGKRCHARIEPEDLMKARAMGVAVKMFCEDHPKMGEVLTQYIEDERAGSETHLYFGMNTGKRLTKEDYMGVMRNLGFTEGEAEKLYSQLMIISRKMANKRGEGERRILINSDFPD